MSTAVPLTVGESWPWPRAQQQSAAHRDRAVPGTRLMTISHDGHGVYANTQKTCKESSVKWKNQSQ